MAKMTDDELMAITDGEMRQALGYYTGKLGMQRYKALAYYLGEAKLDLSPPEVEGRSSVVSPDVRNTIESMLPQLMVKFCGGDEVVSFEPQKPGDEKKAEQATDYINHLFYVRNEGERIAYNWMKDALLSKNGIIKVWWDTRSEETREEYNALTDVELAQLMDDKEVTITEQKSYPDEEDAEQRQEALMQLMPQLEQAVAQAQMNPQAGQAAQQLQAQVQQIQNTPPKMLFDVVCKRTKEGGKVCVENVPPEEFLISRSAKNIETAKFIGHRIPRTASEMESMGYKDVDNITSDASTSSTMNMERIERIQYDDEMAYNQSDLITSSDRSQRIIWVTECWVRVDYDGDGISELRRVLRAGDRILENEIVDTVPFVSITPVPMPHKFFGLSVADLAIEGQKIKTSILRGMLDNMYLQINGRYFAVDGQVNLDDLLTSRPGGVVRVKNPQAAGRLDQGMGDAANAMGMMDYMTGYLEDSTGWSRNSAGTDTNALTDPITATQANIVTNKADMRLDLIARNFAAGFRDLFRLMLKLVAQYQTKEDVVKLRGEWTPVNPRDWRNGFDTTVNVGLGTGNKDQQVQHLSMLNMQQANGLAIGVSTPANIYNGLAEMAKAMGFKSPDKFFTDPSKNPPPQQPDPEQAKIQGQMQIEQVKGQASAQVAQIEAQMNKEVEQFKAQLQAEVDKNRQAQEAAQNLQTLQAEKELEAYKAQLKASSDDQERALKKYVADLQSQTSILIEQMRLGQKREQADMDMAKHHDERQDAAMMQEQEANEPDA